MLQPNHLPISSSIVWPSSSRADQLDTVADQSKWKVYLYFHSLPSSATPNHGVDNDVCNVPLRDHPWRCQLLSNTFRGVWKILVISDCEVDRVSHGLIIPVRSSYILLQCGEHVHSDVIITIVVLWGDLHFVIIRALSLLLGLAFWQLGRGSLQQRQHAR